MGVLVLPMSESKEERKESKVNWKDKDTRQDRRRTNAFHITAFCPDQDQKSAKRDDEMKAITLWMSQHTLEYAYGLEETMEFKLHWQIEIQTKTRHEDHVVGTSFAKTTKLKCHASPTSGKGREKMLEYASKPGQLRGPFTNKEVDNSCIKELLDLKFRGWQQENAEMIYYNHDKQDSRGVNVVVDTKGLAGKNTLQKWVEENGLGTCLPYFGEVKDYMRCAMKYMKLKKKCEKCTFLLNLPRYQQKGKMGNFWAVIETIKDGMVYEDRYAFSKYIGTCPSIWIYTNEFPALHYLSKDRWIFWSTEGDKLTRVDHPDKVPTESDDPLEQDGAPPQTPSGEET